MKGDTVWTITLHDFDEAEMDAVSSWGVFESEESMLQEKSDFMGAEPWKLLFKSPHNGHEIWSLNKTLLHINVHTVE